MKENTKGLLYIILATCAFGTIPIMGKVAINHGAGAADVHFTRFVIVTLFFLIYMRAKGISWRVDRKSTLQLLALGFLCYGNIALFFYLAMQYISPAVGELLLYTYPALVSLASHFFLKDRLTWGKGLSLVLALGGLLLVLYAPVTKVNIQGVVFALLTAVCYSAYIVGNKKVLERVSPVVSTAYMAACCVVYFLIYGLATRSLTFSFNATSFAAMFVLAFWCTILGIISFFKGLVLLGATKAAIVSTFEPVFTLVISAVFLKDPITAVQVVGGGLILVSVLLLEKRTKKDPPPGKPLGFRRKADY